MMGRKTHEQPQGLIGVLLDTEAELGDRDDAAMDLAGFDEPEAIEALTRVLESDYEDPFLKETGQES
jgi:hypothetical protein